MKFTEYVTLSRCYNIDNTDHVRYVHCTKYLYNKYQENSEIVRKKFKLKLAKKPGNIDDVRYIML